MDKQTDSAIRGALGTLKIRPNDESFTSTAVVDWLKKEHNIETAVTDGIVEFKQGETLISTGAALKKFATANTGLFVSEGDDHTKWDAKKKQEFISQHGLAAWEQKIGRKPLRADVDVANCDITKAEYLSMTRQEKSRWIAQHGLEAQAAVLRRAK